MKLQTPWFLALDIDSPDAALRLAQETRAYVGGFKVGPRLTLRGGPQIISELAKLGPVFIDHKFFDIPSTTASAVKAAFEVGASFVTVHAQVGGPQLRELAALEKELNKKRFFRILAVTILTSFTQASLPPNSSSESIGAQVELLANLVMNCGLGGLVCSPEEVQGLKRKHPSAYLVVPGVRLEGEDKGDQSRVLSPQEAIRLGASALVVGRPVVQSSDPVEAAKRIFSLCRQGSS